MLQFCLKPLYLDLRCFFLPSQSSVHQLLCRSDLFDLLDRTPTVLREEITTAHNDQSGTTSVTLAVVLSIILRWQVGSAGRGDVL